MVAGMGRDGAPSAVRENVETDQIYYCIDNNWYLPVSRSVSIST